MERGAHRIEQLGSRLDVPEGGWLFAGSVLLLRPGTAYELRLSLRDPDGKDHDAAVVRVLRARTRSEPTEPAGMRRRHVVPGSGGGQGTAADPFRGLEAAQKAAAPGDLFLLHGGVYTGHWVVYRSGTPERPIIWRGQHDAGGPAVIDGRGSATSRPPHAIEASGTHDVWFEDLTVRNALHGVTFHDAARIVVRRCLVRQVVFGMLAVRNAQGAVQDHFLADNVIEGPSTWPRTRGIEEARGIQLSGEGHVVCYNRIRGFADAIDTFRSPRCAAIDFHNNDLSELTDDGIELDYSERNTRCFFNRLTNVFQGISLQPVFGGPVYVFRNAMDNVAVEPFKLHNGPSGVIIFHNTCVKNGTPALLWTAEPVRHCLMRNNLFVGTAADYAWDTTAPMVDCDFDYEGFGGGPFRLFLRLESHAVRDARRGPQAGPRAQARGAGRRINRVRVACPASPGRGQAGPHAARLAAGAGIEGRRRGRDPAGLERRIPRPTPGPWRLRARRPAAPLWAQDGRRRDSRRSGCGADASVPAMKRGSAAEPPPTARPSGAARCRSRLCRRSVTRGDRRQSRLLQQDPREPDHESRPFVNRSRKSA